MILSKELKPGEKIIQEKIANQLGVSRTPLMKALQHLEHELLVESVPRRGMFVREVSVQEMIDVYYCREGIESMAIRLASSRATDKELQSLSKIFLPFTKSKGKIKTEEYQKADEQFHNLIIALSKNPVLLKMSKLSQVHSQVYSHGLLRTPEETIDEHQRIIEAIVSRNAVKAEMELSEHIKLSRIVLEKLINNNEV